jgi:hypothetical protein
MKKLIVLIFTLFLSPALTFAQYSGGGTESDPWQIAGPNDLLYLANHTEDYNSHFILTADINLAGYTFTTAVIASDTSDEDDFQGTAFTGTFNGSGFVIHNLTINTNGAGDDFLGLFGYTGAGCEIKNLGIEDINITGGDESRYLGGLVGKNDFGTIRNCYATGMVTGGDSSSELGGLVGRNFGTISSCYATCAVTGGNSSGFLGGLVGWNELGLISNCYATGVTGKDGANYIGGLVGENDYGAISNCYATGAVASGDNLKWLGGLVGVNFGTVSSCFWDTQTSGLASGWWGIGLTTSAMQNVDNYLRAGWDFKDEFLNGSEDVWTMPAGGDYPLLTWQTESSTPFNDEFSNALQINPGSAINGTTVEASGLDITQNGYGDCLDVWYYFEPASNAKYAINLNDSNFDTTLAVFDSAGKEIVFNDDFFSEGSAVVLKAGAGKRYYIRVSGYDGQTGSFTLSVTEGAIQAIQGDLNYDGFVNLVDFALMAQNWLIE